MNVRDRVPSGRGYPGLRQRFSEAVRHHLADGFTVPAYVFGGSEGALGEERAPQPYVYRTGAHGICD